MELIHITLFFSISSLISTIIVLYLFFISKRYKIFEFRLILYLQLSDLFLSISLIFISFTPPHKDDFLCKFDSILENSSNLSSVFFTTTISIVLLLKLQFNTYVSRKFELYILFFNFGFPFIMNLM